MTASDDKSLKGKGHDFPPHDHEAIRHSHEHSHITHYRKPGERDEWKHLTATHDLWDGKRPSEFRPYARRHGAGRLAPASRPQDRALDWRAALDSEGRAFGAGGHGCSSA
jgi:hypothetical protein